MFEEPADLNTVMPRPVSEAAFLFADIVGFTAFTEAEGDERAAELAWRLRLGVESQLDHDAHVVKALGDAVMVRIADPADAAAAGLRIVTRALDAPGDPSVRVGIHCGRAVEADGDFFGTAVNIAARVAALAGPGQVLVTDAVAAAARGHTLRVASLGERTLRNVDRPIPLHVVSVPDACAANAVDGAVATHKHAPAPAQRRTWLPQPVGAVS
jgi:class 3 adenylate cyclase